MSTRVLFAERISKETEESTAITRQDEKLHKRLSEDIRDVTLAGKAVDYSVSGAVDMVDRPELGQWLTPHGRELWDEIWVTTADRLSRNDMHFMSFVQDIYHWGKVLIVLDDPSLDLTTPEGRVMAHMRSIGPAKELASIKKRCADSHSYLRTTDRWPGGIPPYGYDLKPVIVTDAQGKEKESKVLVLDEETSTIVHQMRKWIVEGASIYDVSKRLNAQGEPTPKDLRRARKGKTVRGETWSDQSVRKILTSPALLGCKLYQQQPITNKDGSYHLIADPVLSQDEWDTLQNALRARRAAPSRVSRPSPLGRVVWCDRCKGTCSHAIYRRHNVTRYYFCSGGKAAGYKRCQGVAMRAQDVEELMEQQFLERCGHLPVVDWTFHRGSDHQAELDELRRRISRLREDRERGAYDDDPDYYAGKMKEYTEHRKHLESLPTVEAGWRATPTDVTYAEVWEKGGQEDRRNLLVKSGIKFWINGRNDWHVYVPEDILEQSFPGYTYQEPGEPVDLSQFGTTGKADSK